MNYIKLFYSIMYSIYSAELKLGTEGGSSRIEFPASTWPGVYYTIHRHLRESFKYVELFCMNIRPR